MSLVSTSRFVVMLLVAMLLCAGSMVAAPPAYAQPADTTPPRIGGFVGTSSPSLQGGIYATDLDSGLQSIVVTESWNLDTTFAPFTPGTTSPILVLSTVMDPTSLGRLTFIATDVSGNSSTVRAVFDPTVKAFVYVRDVTVTTDDAMIEYALTRYVQYPDVVTCDPDPKSVFPVGSTIGTCTLPGGASVSATITVIDATQGSFDELVELVTATPINGSTTAGDRIRQNLLAIVNLASFLYDAEQNQMSCLILSRFELEVRSQVSKRRITRTDAAPLYTASAEIRSRLSCGGTPR